jgi:quercetin dioxygenase-like cupin family protein
MEIKRSGSQPSAKGPAEWFTGTVRIDPLIDAPVPARVNGASVTFEPGARTAWHTHPLGQTLIVTSGVGRAGRWGGPVEEIRPGDVIWIPPGEKHWHGASPTTAMTHIAIQEKLDGKPVDWLEHVTAEQYEGRWSAGESPLRGPDEQPTHSIDLWLAVNSPYETIYYIPCQSGSDVAIYRLNTATGERRQVGRLEGYQAGMPSGFEVSPDERTILYDRLVSAGEDLMVMENFK